jgi:hypothetical protein
MTKPYTQRDDCGFRHGKYSEGKAANDDERHQARPTSCEQLPSALAVAPMLREKKTGLRRLSFAGQALADVCASPRRTTENPNHV